MTLWYEFDTMKSQEKEVDWVFFKARPGSYKRFETSQKDSSKIFGGDWGKVLITGARQVNQAWHSSGLKLTEKDLVTRKVMNSSFGRVPTK